MTIQLLDEIYMPDPTTEEETEKQQKQKEKVLKKAAKAQAAGITQNADVINLDGQNAIATASLQTDNSTESQNVMMASASPATALLLSAALILLATAAIFYKKKVAK